MKKNDKQVEKLIKRYNKTGICLGLGAGISIDSGIPLWYNLLKNISQQILGETKTFDSLIDNKVSFEAITSFLKSSSKQEEFHTILRKCLYQDFLFYDKRIRNKKIKTELVKHIEETNLTLSAIGKFCAIRNGNSFSSNPNVKGIMNFNIDSILRSYCLAKFDTRILRTTERASAGRIGNAINNYHIHGILRFDAKRGKTEESPDKVVFAEEEYYGVFSNPYSLFNYSFLHYLREYSFLFIGLSMQDSNLRRLLYLSKKEIMDGYRDEGLSPLELRRKEKSKVNKHYTILRDSGNETIKKFHETTLNDLGVNIIWINKYSEISEKLKCLYNSVNGRDWADI